MIIFKENDRFYFSIPMGPWTSDVDIDCEENSPAWHINDQKGTIALVTQGMTRAGDVLRYSDLLNVEELNRNELLRVSCQIPNELANTNCIIEDGEIGVGICIARDNEAYEITKFGVVKSIGDVEVFNSNRSVSMVIWEAVKDTKNVEQRIKAFYKFLGDKNRRNYFPIMLMNTKEEGHTLVENE